MLDNLKELLNIDSNVPFILGMTTQIKTFVIDKAMFMLIGSLMMAAGSSSVLSYVVYESHDNIATLRKDVSELILSQNTLTTNMNIVIKDISNFSVSWEKHLIGHPLKITK